VVHGSEVTLFLTWFVALSLTRNVTTPNTDVARSFWRVSTPVSAAHCAPLPQNSRSTRRERRNQHSTHIIV
jgi:hypothetical protein